MSFLWINIKIRFSLVLTFFRTIFIKSEECHTDIFSFHRIYLTLNRYTLILQIPRNEKHWKSWYDTEAPERNVIPDGYNASLDTFGKLLLIRLVP